MESLKKLFEDDEWRESLDPEIKRKMELLLRRVSSEERSYKSAKHKATAQIWVALADVYSRVERMDKRLNSIERALRGEEPKEGGGEFKEGVLKDSLKKY